MFDFRYHALSLVAVFLALGIGILLGVTLGDSLVSEATRSVRSSLRDDVVEARRRAREEQASREQRDRLIEAAFPLLASDRLRGERVALVALGELPDDIESAAREVVETAGGSVDSVSVLDVEPVEADLREAFPGDGARPNPSASELEALARRLGASTVAGGRTAMRLQAAYPKRFRGDYRGAESVVIYRAPLPAPHAADGELDGPDSPADRRAKLDRALIRGMERRGATVVGVEESNSEPSQIPFFVDARLTSVDSVDLIGGRVALVFALDGVQGTFGFKSTADEPLPELATGRVPR